MTNFEFIVVVAVVAVERISCLEWDWGTGPLLLGSPTNWSPPEWSAFVGNWRGELCREVGIRRGGTHSWHSGPVGSCTRLKEDSSHFGAAPGLFWCFVVVSARQGWLLEVSSAKPCSVRIRWWCCSLRLYESTWCHFCTILRCSSVVARLSLGGSWLRSASWVFEVGPCGSIVGQGGSSGEFGEGTVWRASYCVPSLVGVSSRGEAHRCVSSCWCIQWWRVKTSSKPPAACSSECHEVLVSKLGRHNWQQTVRWPCRSLWGVPCLSHSSNQQKPSARSSASLFCWECCWSGCWVCEGCPGWLPVSSGSSWSVLYAVRF